MKQNVKIAKQLVKLAKSLIAKKERLKVINKRTLKQDGWSSSIEFNGKFGDVPVRGIYQKFHQRSSVVGPGDIWFEKLIFRPYSGAAEVTAEWIYTDRIWGRGYWEFNGPSKSVEFAKELMQNWLI